MASEAVRRPRGRPRAHTPPIDSGLVQAVDRGLMMMGVIAASDGLTLSEIAQRTGLAASSAHRILSTLEQHRFVAHDEARGRWLIGVGAFEAGSAFLRNRGLAGLGRPMMHRLMELAGETVNLGVEDDGEVVFISQVESHDVLRAFFRVGTRAFIHASGIGKALLAEMPAERVRAIVAVRGLPRFTARTIGDAGALLAELGAIRARGYAIDDEERSPGMRCIAAPVFNEFGEAMAGLSVSGPAVRLSPERVATLGPEVRRFADEVTASIGGVRL